MMPKRKMAFIGGVHGPLGPGFPVLFQKAPSITLATLANAPGRKLWLRASSGVNAAGAAEFVEANSEYLSVADNAELSLAADTDFWAACWVRIDAVTSSNQHIFNQYDTGNDDRAWTLFVGSGSPTRLNFNISSNGADFTQVTGTDATLGVWQLALMWHDSANDTINIRIDDAAVTSEDYTSGTHNSAAPVMLGARPNGGVAGAFFQGGVDQAAFGKPPGPIASVIDDIHATLFNAGNGVPYVDLTAQQKTDWGLVAFWELDELSGERGDSHSTNNLTDNNTVGASLGVVEGPADDGDPVTRWRDQIGLVDYEAATISQAPAFDSATPEVGFDGIDDRLDFAGNPAGSTATSTLFLAFGTLPGTLPTNVGIYDEQDSAAKRYKWAISSGGDFAVEVDGTTAIFSGVVPATGDVFAARRDGTNVALFINGVFHSNGTVGGGVLANDNLARLGGNTTGAGFMEFALRDGFLSDQALSDADIASLSAELA